MISDWAWQPVIVILGIAFLWWLAGFILEIIVGLAEITGRRW